MTQVLGRGTYKMDPPVALIDVALIIDFVSALNFEQASSVVNVQHFSTTTLDIQLQPIIKNWAKYFNSLQNGSLWMVYQYEKDLSEVI
jgi:hypothetical protein